MRNAALTVLMLLATVPVFGDQFAAPPNPQVTARFGALRQQGSPYRQLFETRAALDTALQEQVATTRPKRRVVCGMTIIEVDPGIDSKMAREVPKPPDVKYTIRAIDPPICNPNGTNK